MRRIILLAGLLVAAVATVGAQTALADAPTIESFAPASGPPAWSVTLAGTGFTGATAVTFTPIDSSYPPEAAIFTVQSDTTIVATVPFLSVPPLAAALVVETPNGSSTSPSNFTVDGQVGLSEHRGASGEPITLTGSGFTGATRIVFGTWRKQVLGDEPFALANRVRASFTMIGDTKIAVTVPVLQVGRHYWVAVVSPAGKSVSSYASSLYVVRPRLLKEPFGSGRAFAIRPDTVDPFTYGGLVVGKLDLTRGHAIRWLAWKSGKAFGVASVWTKDGIRVNGIPTFVYRCHCGSITASRVRGGLFTRMTVRWKRGRRTDSSALEMEHNGRVWDWQYQA